MLQLSSSALFGGGIAMMVLAAGLGIIAVIVLRLRKKRLEAQLEKEYGKKRHA